MFHIQKQEESGAVTDHFEPKLYLALEHMQTLHPGLLLKDGDTVKIKLTGDGTNCGKRLTITNIGFVDIIGEILSVDNILAITTCPEKYHCLKSPHLSPVLTNLISRG